MSRYPKQNTGFLGVQRFLTGCVSFPSFYNQTQRLSVGEPSLHAGLPTLLKLLSGVRFTLERLLSPISPGSFDSSLTFCIHSGKCSYLVGSHSPFPEQCPQRLIQEDILSSWEGADCLMLCESCFRACCGISQGPFLPKFVSCCY